MSSYATTSVSMVVCDFRVVKGLNSYENRVIPRPQGVPHIGTTIASVLLCFCFGGVAAKTSGFGNPSILCRLIVIELLWVSGVAVSGQRVMITKYGNIHWERHLRCERSVH